MKEDDDCLVKEKREEEKSFIKGIKKYFDKSVKKMKEIISMNRVGMDNHKRNSLIKFFFFFVDDFELCDF